MKKTKDNIKSDEIKIIEVKTRADLKRFVRFQNDLYKGNKFFVPDLELNEIKMFSKKNPSLDEVDFQTFIALKNDKVVGRIAVIIQKTYNTLHNCKYARFTRFDLVDDSKVAKILIETACEWARAKGMQVIHGPLGFNDLDKEGLLVEGFDKVGTFANFYNYAYYKTHLEEIGFEKEIDWLEFLIEMPKELDSRMTKVAERMSERLKLSIVPQKISKSRILKLYGKEIFSVLNECYAGLHGVIPITDKVRDDVLKQFKTIIRREHICLVLNKDGNVIGFGLTAPNMSRSLNASRGRYTKLGFLPVNAFKILREARRPKFIDMCLIAVVPEYRAKGVNAIIINEMFKNLVKRKIKSLETNLQMETNTDVQGQFDGFNKQLIKRRRCYRKEL